MKRRITVRSWLVATAVVIGVAVAAQGSEEGPDCRLCVEDVNGDFVVDVHDVSMVLEHWGCVSGRWSVDDREPGSRIQVGRPVEPCAADCDDDGDVDVMDLVAVIAAWGNC